METFLTIHIITEDTLRPDHLVCYGYTDKRPRRWTVSRRMPCVDHYHCSDARAGLTAGKF